jgi:hypothetical protein
LNSDLGANPLTPQAFLDLLSELWPLFTEPVTKGVTHGVTEFHATSASVILSVVHTFTDTAFNVTFKVLGAPVYIDVGIA